jgi:hypothetical protein
MPWRIFTFSFAVGGSCTLFVPVIMDVCKILFNLEYLRFRQLIAMVMVASCYCQFTREFLVHY